jgi:hypothetical protein
VPKPGSLTVAQVSLKSATKPVLKLNNPSELSGGVIVAGVARQRRGRYVARIVIARLGSKTSAVALQDFSFSALGNRGVTGAVSASFPSFLATSMSNPASPLCKSPDTSTFSTAVLAGHLFTGLSASSVLTFGINGPCGHPTKGSSAFFGAVRGSSTGPFTFNAVDVATGDFNGDGIDDIVAVDGMGTFTQVVGLGDGTFGLPLNLFNVPPPVAVTSGDIDLDGFSDVVLAESNAIEVFNGSFLGAGSPRVVVTGLNNILGVTTGNFNGDSLGDLAVATASGIHIFFNTPTSPFEAGPILTLPGGDRPVDVLSGDINGDGVPDLVILGTDGLGDFALSVSTNRGGMFSTPVDEQFFNANPAVFTFGRQTMLFSTSPPAVGVTASGGVRLFPIFPGGTLGPQQLFPVGEGASGAIFGNVNGDNLNDLLILNGSAGSVSTFIGTNGGFAKTPLTSLVGQNPVSLGLLNFNNDGKPDLVVANGAAGGVGSITVLAGTGTGAFTH